MSRSAFRAGICFLFSASLLLPARYLLSAQQTDSPALRQVRVMLPFPEQNEEDPGPDGTAWLLHDIIQAELSKFGLKVIGPEALPEAGQEIDFVLRIFFRTDPSGRMVIGMTALNSAESSVFFGTVRQARADLTLFNSLNRMVGELVPNILAALPFPEAEELLDPPPPMTFTYRFSSPDEGAEIWLIGSDRFGKVSDGAAEIGYFPLLAGTSIPVEVRKPDYRTARRVIPAAPGETDIALRPLIPEMRLVRSMSWSTSRFLGAGLGVRYFPVPDWLFIGAEQYLYGTYALSPGARPVFHSDTRLMAGGYIIAPPESRFRLGLSAAFQLHLSWLTGFEPEDRPVALYPDFSVTFLALWFEYAFPRFTPYLQTEFFYIFEKQRNIFPPGGGQAVSLGVMLPWR